MADKKTLTFCLMDGPYENARTTTALRLVDLAAKRGYNVNVFAFEGAVQLPITTQKAHPNAVHGRDEDEEDHPLPHEWIESIARTADAAGGKLEWISCGLCVDERGANDGLSFVQRGGPSHLWAWVQASDNTLIIPTK